VLQEDAYLCNLTCWDTLWVRAINTPKHFILQHIFWLNSKVY